MSGPVRAGTAKYEFRPWLIIGPQSKPAARAALAAGEQGRFWNYITLFYRNQGEENSGYVTDDFLTSIAKGAGVRDIAKWNADRQSTKFDSELRPPTSRRTRWGSRAPRRSTSRARAGEGSAGRPRRRGG